MDGESLRILAYFIPPCVAAAGVLVWSIRTRPANVTADEAHEDGQWRRVADWNARLQKEVETCHRERDEARAEALKWKAIAEGIGQNRQEAAALMAAERLADDHRKREDKKT